MNTIIAGFPRCGTTSLFRYLSAHPFVCGSRVKETNFFVSVLSPVGGREAVLSQYEQLFAQESSHKTTLEASPSYSHRRDIAVQQIHRFLPDAKLVFVMRDPVQRLWSYFQKKQSVAQEENAVLNEAEIHQMLDHAEKGNEMPLPDKLRKANQQLLLGKYIETLRDYAGCFEARQVLPIFLENLSGDPYRVMQTVCTFLGLDSTLYRDFEFMPENRSGEVKSKALYRFALQLNAAAEPFLNRHPAIRNQFRRLHHRLNLNPSARMSESISRRLQFCYHRANLELRDYVLRYYPEIYEKDLLPRWLHE